MAVDTNIKVERKNIKDVNKSYFSYKLEDETIFDNSISIKNTVISFAYDMALALLFTEKDAVIRSNNKAKTISATYSVNSDKTVTAAAIYGSKGLTIEGKKYLQSLSASAKNSGVATAYGIYVNSLVSNAEFTKKYTVSANATGSESTAYATGFSVMKDDKANNIQLKGGFSGTLSVSAVSKKGEAYATGIASENTEILTKTAGKITVSATGNLEDVKKANPDKGGEFELIPGTVEAMGIRGDTITLSNYSAKLSVTSKNKGRANAFGVYSLGALVVSGGKKGSVTVSATSSVNGDANSIAVMGKSIQLSTFNYSVKATSSSKKGSTVAYGIYSTESVAVAGDIAGAVTVSAKKSAYSTDGVAMAYAFNVAGDISAKDIVSTVSATAQNAGGAVAYAINAVNMTVEDITGKISASATSKAYDGKAATASSIIYSSGIVTVDRISSKLTSKASNAKATAYGIAAKDIKIADMSKMNLTVTASSNDSEVNAVGLYASNNLYVGDAGLDFGKITVTANSYAGAAVGYGIVAGENITVVNENAGQTVSGTVKVTAVGFACGVNADKIDVISSLNITVSAMVQAYGYLLDGNEESELNIVDAKVKATVSTPTYKNRAYAIFVDDGTGDGAEQEITLRDQSTLQGHVKLGKGEDSLTIESGSKLKGGLIGVEELILEITDSGKKSASLWDAAAFDDTTKTDLNIDFDYGMTGDFVLCTKSSSTAWSDLVNEKIELDLGDAMETTFNLSSQSNTYADAFYEFELKTKGNKMILSVKDI